MTFKELYIYYNEDWDWGIEDWVLNMMYIKYAYTMVYTRKLNFNRILFNVHTTIANHVLHLVNFLQYL